MISIVIPIFNEENILPELWKRLYQVISSWEYETEVIFVNDGSTDASLSIMKEFSKTSKSLVKIVQL
jgi:glycosyltransferase involved in cell wall biosynthesis